MSLVQHATHSQDPHGIILRHLGEEASVAWDTLDHEELRCYLDTVEEVRFDLSTKEGEDPKLFVMGLYRDNDGRTAWWQVVTVLRWDGTRWWTQGDELLLELNADIKRLQQLADALDPLGRPRGLIRLLESVPAYEAGDACQVPPIGWSCSRAPGHDGPCAALPSDLTGSER